MSNKIINGYYNILSHLRVAQPFLQDIELIDSVLNNFDYDEATRVISHVATRHQTDFNTIGKHLTGIMVFNEDELPPKTSADLINDLHYVKDCVIISAAVHCGLENTIHSAIVKINRENENN